MKTWWERASTEQRLAQIDGGIECGMTAKQISMCLGAGIYVNGKNSAVLAFGNKHGRHFPDDRAAVGVKIRPIQQVLSRRRFGVDEISMPGAFDLFDDAPARRSSSDALNFEEA